MTSETPPVQYAPRLTFPAQYSVDVPDAPPGEKRVVKLLAGAPAPFTGLLFTPPAQAAAMYKIDVLKLRLAASEEGGDADREYAQEMIGIIFSDLSSQIAQAETDTEWAIRQRDIIVGIAILEAVTIGVMLAVQGAD